MKWLLWIFRLALLGGIVLLLLHASRSIDDRRSDIDFFLCLLLIVFFVVSFVIRTRSLFDILASGDHAALEGALVRGFNPEVRYDPPRRGAMSDSDSGFTPLFIAVLSGDEGAARILLRHGADPNSRTDAQGTPLLAAVDRGNLSMIQLLLEKGADPNAAHADAMTPLMLAAMLESPELMGFLLRAGARVDQQLPAEHPAAGWGALHLAVANQRYAAIPVLLGAGADPFLEDTQHVTPLMLALRDPGLQSLRLLLDSGIDLSRPGPEALQISLAGLGVRSGSLEALKLLLARGARVDQAPAESRITALHHAALLGDVPAARVLLEHGANIRQRAARGFTVLHSATFCGQESRHPLLVAGKDPEKERRSSDDSRIERIISFLLRSGAERDAQDEEGNMPIHLAAINGNQAAVQALLTAGADAMARNAEDFTPLHFAVVSGAPGLIRLLLGRGAEVNARASYGRSPLDMLAYNADRFDKAHLKTLAKLLMDHGAKHSAMPGWVEEGKYEHIVWERPAGEDEPK